MLSFGSVGISELDATGNMLGSAHSITVAGVTSGSAKVIADALTVIVSFPSTEAIVLTIV